jgi:hypothetical protein
MAMQENVVIHKQFPLHRRTAEVRSIVGPAVEAVTYAGAALVLAAMGTWIYPRWVGWSHAVQPFLPGLAAIALVVLGWLIRDEHNPVARRLTGALWAFAVPFAGWFVVALLNVADYAGPWERLIVAGSMVVVAFGLWLLHRRSLQVVTLVAAMLGAAYVGLALLPTPADWMYATAFAGIGAVVIALAALGLATPRVASFVTGTIAALIAPVAAITVVTASSTPIRSWIYVGLALGVAVAVIGVLARSAPLRVLGAVGVFGYAAALIQRYYVSSAWLGVTLAILGALMIVGAVVALWVYEPGMREVAEIREREEELEAPTEARLAR